MAKQVQANKLTTQQTQTALNQTESDLANAVLLIQERDAKIAELESQLNLPVEIEIPAEPNAETTMNEHPHRDPDPINMPTRPIVHGEHDPEPLVANYNTVVIPDLSINAESDTAPVNAGFGTNFPPNPRRGDMYLRVDYLPSRLYKWNEKKWIEVDKTKTDSFAYDDAYIQHLIEKIDSGEYDVDLLSAAEQEQISRYLDNGKLS